MRQSISSFRGNWRFSWIVGRYWRSCLSGANATKLKNAALALLEMRCGRTRVASSPAVLRVEPTNICNLRCVRCSCGIGADPRPKGLMALADYQQVLDQNRQKGWLLRLDGNGEPTLHPQIFDMIAIAKSCGYAVSMSTNLCTRQSDEIKAFLECGLDRLIVAIDGSNQASYERYRVGGDLSLVLQRLAAMCSRRGSSRHTKPHIEVQFLDWGYNHHEIQPVRAMAQDLGADKFQVICPDWPVLGACARPQPRRCFWLWFVLTVDWRLDYHSCTNAWSCPWPRLNLKDVPSHEFWNHSLMQEARRYNLNKSSVVIGEDTGCNCGDCSDMLVVNRPVGYVCK
jgi:hypothetical protein